MSVSIPAIKKSLSKTQNINIVIIGVNIYCVACCLKRAQIFVISIKNIQYQVKKEVRAEINLKRVVSKKYHNFLNIFLKKYLDTFPLYQKYDHKIYLQKK